jgi:hypothetical protein
LILLHKIPDKIIFDDMIFNEKKSIYFNIDGRFAAIFLNYLMIKISISGQNNRDKRCGLIDNDGT